MSEPIYIAQTFEPEHVEMPLDWWRARWREAVEEGATWPRYSWTDDEPYGLLIEAWEERPHDQGEPRWSLTAESETPDTN